MTMPMKMMKMVDQDEAVDEWCRFETVTVAFQGEVEHADSTGQFAE